MGSTKNTKWLPLDADALDDPKIMDLVAALGMEGYGIYIMLIQCLTKQEPDYMLPLSHLKHLAYRNRTSEEKVKAVVTGFYLFEIDNDQFYSNSLLRRMERYDNLRNINREKALKKWEIYYNTASKNTPALPRHNHSNTTAMQIREDKIREEENRIEENINTESDNSDISISNVNDKVILIDQEPTEAQKLFDKLIKYYPENVKPKILKQKTDSVDTLDKLIRIDKKTPDLIIEVVKYARSSFYAPNLLSINKLRRNTADGTQVFIYLENLMKSKPKEQTIGRREKRVNRLWDEVKDDNDYTTPQKF